jgi:hypothetical protein
MALPLREFKRLASQALQVIARLQAEYAEDGTHGELRGCLDSKSGKEKTRISRCGFPVDSA